MSLRTPALRLLACGAGGALLGGVAAAQTSGRARLALLAALVAVVLAVLVPWRVEARGPRTALRDGAALTVGAGLVGLLLAGLGPAVWVVAYLLAWSAGLAGWTAALPRRGVGQTLIGAGALGLLALPYWGAIPLGLLGDEEAVGLVLHTPLAVVCETFAGVDLLRAPTLYRVFPAAQAVPYAPATPLAALGLAAAVAACGWAALLGRRLATRAGWRPGRLPRAPLAALALGAVLVGAPAPAEAQIFPEGGQIQGGNTIGDLVTRVNLGYYVPFLYGGDIRLDGDDGEIKGSELDFHRDLELEPIYMMPTFEVAMSWDNAGMILVQYAEAEWRGSDRIDAFDLKIEEQVYRRGEVIETRYRFRTLALVGRLDVPLAEWLSAWIVTTHRYVKYELRVRNNPVRDRVHNSLETYLPTVGLGLEFYLYEMISLYGSLQYLDFRTSLFGGSDNQHVQRYREWRAGVRLMLIQHAHVMVEFYSLETHVREKETDLYRQDLQGVRVQVAVLF